MSTAQTIVLGAVAGLTIFLGLPLGRVEMTSLRSRAFLNALSAGIPVCGRGSFVPRGVS